MCVGVSDRLIVVRTRKIILKIVEGSHNFQDFSFNSVKFVVFFFKHRRRRWFFCLFQGARGRASLGPRLYNSWPAQTFV